MGRHEFGRGLLDAVEIVSGVAEPANQKGGSNRRIVLVTDLQQGSRLDELADHQWPADVPLDLRTVTTTQATNAGLQLLSDGAPTELPNSAGDLRVGVYNDKESTTDQFKLTWLDAKDQPLAAAIDVYVPAGESRVIKVPRPASATIGTAQQPAGAAGDKTVKSEQAAESPNSEKEKSLTDTAQFAGQRLHLTGDANEFDNTLYLAARPQTEISVVFIGVDEANDPSGLRYFLERALTSGGLRSMTLRAVPPGDDFKLEPPGRMPLIVVAAEPSGEQLKLLRPQIEAGGTVLWVLTKVQPSPGLAALLGVDKLEPEEADLQNNYTMLSQIAFDHPLFAPMSGPQFNDFTQIYFWKYRRLDSSQLPEAKVLARFENGDPAVLERRIGQGQLIVFTSGWQPTDSQLARSWKFVPLVSALVDGRRARLSDRTFFIVDEPVPLHEQEEGAADLSITKPDGSHALVPTGARTFGDTSEPGVYTLATGDRPETIAVNLDPAESRTSPLAVEIVQQYAVPLAKSAVVVENEKQKQQLRDAQLESRQKYWQWLVAAAFGLAITETFVAGRITKTSNVKRSRYEF